MQDSCTGALVLYGVINLESDPEITLRNFITADNVMIVGDVAGSGTAPTVILLHGAGQTRYSWAGTLDALADTGYRAVAYDARGHGQSGWSVHGDYSYSVRARDLETVIAQVTRPVALVGASMGGVTAMRAIVDGLRPSALILVDIVLRPDPLGVARIRDFMRGNPSGFASLEAAADAVAAYNPSRPRPKDSSRLLRNLRDSGDGRLHWHWDPRILPPNLEDDMASMERLVEGMRSAPSIPTLLIRGARSDVVSEAAVAEFREILPALEVIDIASAGHMVAGDSNDIFNCAILDFLERHFPPS
jgi:pimeloyl-ACP methyl ester carboxylesterase